MSDRTHDSVNCEAISGSVHEFALGTISGRDRSLVLEHLETCPHCRAELDSLAAVTDALLLLAPEIEPPLGFESRLVERFLKDEPEPVPARSHRGIWLAAAALLVAVVGFGVGTVTTHGSNPTHYDASRPLTARLTSSGVVLGQVIVTPGKPSWMSMTVDDGNWSGVAWCQVTLRSGRVETVGRFTLLHGYGAWTAPLKAAGNQVRTAQLVSVDGKVIASAILRT